MPGVTVALPEEDAQRPLLHSHRGNRAWLLGLLLLSGSCAIITFRAERWRQYQYEQL